MKNWQNRPTSRETNELPLDITESFGDLENMPIYSEDLSNKRS